MNATIFILIAFVIIGLILITLMEDKIKKLEDEVVSQKHGKFLAENSRDMWEEAYHSLLAGQEKEKIKYTYEVERLVDEVLYTEEVKNALEDGVYRNHFRIITEDGYVDFAEHTIQRVERKKIKD